MQLHCPICGSTDHEFVKIGGQSMRVCPEMLENHFLMFNPKDFKFIDEELVGIPESTQQMLLGFSIKKIETNREERKGVGESQSLTKEGV